MNASLTNHIAWEFCEEFGGSGDTGNQGKIKKKSIVNHFFFLSRRKAKGIMKQVESIPTRTGVQS